MSELPKFAGQSCCGAGFGTVLSPSAGTSARHRSPGSPRRRGRRSRPPRRRSAWRRRRRSRPGTRRQGVRRSSPAGSPGGTPVQLAERAGRRAGRAVACRMTPTSVPRIGRVGPVRRRERVVDDVHVRAVGRDRRRGVVAAVARRLDRLRSRPARAVVRRLGEVHVRRVDVPLTYVMTMRSVASAPVGAPLAMSTLGAGARSLRAPAMPSISGRPCTGSNTPGWVTGPATGAGFDHELRPSAERDIELEGLAAGRLHRPDAEYVGVSLRIGADRAAVGRVALAVVRGRADLVLRPRVAAVARGGHDQRRRGRPVAFCSRSGPADVDVAEERAGRGVVGPDLLLVGERRRRLLETTTGASPGTGAVRRQRRLHVVGARNGDRLEALERLVAPAWRRRSTPGWRSHSLGAVGPAGIPGPGRGPERDGRVAVGDQPVLVVPGSVPDGSLRGAAARIVVGQRRPRHPRAVRPV